MKEIKKEITTEQIIYEITKEELESIKKEARSKGRRDIAGYIGFTLGNFNYKLNLGGAVSFLSALSDFLCFKTNTIPNTYGYSLWDYIEKYR